METDELMRERFDALVADINPPADLADRVVRRRRAHRRRARTIGAGAAGAAAVGAAAAAGGLGGTRAPRPAPLGHRQLQLASYHFSLPRDAGAVAASAADCGIPAIVTFPNASATGAPQPGGTDADQPAVASAVIGDGGCVSMLLTDPFAQGGVDQPDLAFPVVDESSISIDGDQGTVGTYEVMGGNVTNGSGVALNGARNVELSLDIPAGDGRFQMLVVAAAGVSEQQLEQIVASGLQS